MAQYTFTSSPEQEAILQDALARENARRLGTGQGALTASQFVGRHLLGWIEGHREAMEREAGQEFRALARAYKEATPQQQLAARQAIGFEE